MPECAAASSPRCAGVRKEFLTLSLLRLAGPRAAAQSAETSMRRYEQQGVLRMLLLWSGVWFSSMFGDLHRRVYEPIR